MAPRRGVSLAQPPAGFVSRQSTQAFDAAFGLPVAQPPATAPSRRSVPDFAPAFGSAVAQPSSAAPRPAPQTFATDFGAPAQAPAGPAPATRDAPPVFAANFGAPAQTAKAEQEGTPYGLPIEQLPIKFPRGFSYLHPMPSPPTPPDFGDDVGGSIFSPINDRPSAYGQSPLIFGNYHMLTMPQTEVTKAQPITFGLNTKIAPPDLPPGASPTMQNFLVRDGGIEPRYKLAQLGSNVLQDFAIGAAEYSTTTGLRFPVAVSASTVAWFNSESQVWSSLSYVPNTVNSAPNGANTDFWDFCTFYHPTLDENILVMTNGDNAAFEWDGASTTSSALFSSLTNAPVAKYVAAFDSRLLFAYITDGALTLPQRVIWTGRGLPESANQIASDGGFYDLLDARGRIQRLVEDGPRILVFFEYEIWEGFRADYPFDLQFIPLDRTVGLTAPFSAVKTPNGVVFLGSDYKVYLLPHGGTPRAISDPIWASMRDEIAYPERAVGAYDLRLGEYQLFYPIVSGTGRPQHSRHYNLNDQTWTAHTFGHDISTVAPVTLSSSATSFGGLVGTFTQQTLTYIQMESLPGLRTVLVGTSAGTLAQFSSTATADLGTSVDAQYLAHLGNASPDRRQYLKELWIDYRADATSALTIKVSRDFGQTFDDTYAVTLPTASPSAQTVVQVMESAVYPSVQFEADAGTRFRLQRVLARLEDVGRG